MKHLTPIILSALLFATGCTSTKNLSYLNNLSETIDPQYFPYEMPDYKVQYRDILYIDVKTQNPDGKIENVLQGSNNAVQSYIQGEANQYLIGYNIDKEGNIFLPVIGKIFVGGSTIKEIKDILKTKIDSVFHFAYVEVKLLSFKFTILGEVKNPGTFVNYNDYLTVIEAIGRAGGISDFGRRDNILVIRSGPDGSKTYRLNLQDKSIMTSEAYFLMPNDVIIIEPFRHKIFNMNLPTISFAVTTVTGILTTTLLLLNYFGK